VLAPAIRPQHGCRVQRTADRPLRIIIVEDEAIIAVLLEEMVQSLGHEVVATASRESEAVCVTEKLQPDLVLMDVKLSDGGSGIRAAKAITIGQDTQIVFCSAYSGHPAVMAQMKSIRPAYILAKPIRAADLETALQIVQQSLAVEHL
jgi:two-component system, response regulator PdtaR